MIKDRVKEFSKVSDVIKAHSCKANPKTCYSQVKLLKASLLQQVICHLVLKKFKHSGYYFCQYKDRICFSLFMWYKKLNSKRRFPPHIFKEETLDDCQRYNLKTFKVSSWLNKLVSDLINSSRQPYHRIDSL